MCTEGAVSIGEWIRTLAAALSPILVLVGWWLVNLQSNKREGRKELRQLVDRTINTVGEAVDAAIRYHTGSSDKGIGDSKESWKMLLAVDQIKSQLVVLGHNGMDTESCIGPFIRLKQAATGHDFMTKKYVPWASDDGRWLVLIDASKSLSHNLDLLFLSKTKAH